jgi:hypothetical protein
VYESKRNAERFRRDAERPTRRSPFGPHARTEAGDRHAETHHTSADPYQRRTVVRSGSNSLRSPATFSKAFVIATRARQDFRRRRQRELGPQSVGESRRANCRAAGIVPRLSRLAPQHRSDAPHAGQPPEPLSLPSSVPAEPPSSGEHFANWSRCPTFCSGWSWDFSLRRKCARPRKRRCIQAPRGKQTESARIGGQDPHPATDLFDLRGPDRFPPVRSHVLLNSLFRVLCNFRSHYLFAIGLVSVFSFGRSLPPA